MTLTEAAKLFEAWADREGLFAQESYLVPTQHEAEDFNAIINKTIPGLNFLRTKQVLMVGINEHEDQIVVFLRRAAPKSKKQLAALPSTIDGFSIRYEQAAIDVIGSTATTPYGAPFAIRASGGSQFYTCGSSISVGNWREAGTLSCLLRDAHGTLFGLSNNHVSGSCNQAPVGLPIVAPGILDVTAGNWPPFTIGFHASAMQMTPGSPDVVAYASNNDAAVFQLHAHSAISSYQQHFYDTPATTLPLKTGMLVEKVGRTTGRTIGKVISESISPVPVGYSAGAYGFGGTVYFTNCFVVHGLPGQDRFSAGGDSGSLVVHTDAAGVKHAVGIVFAGGENNLAPGGGHSMILPIEPILHHMQMSLVSGHNV